MQSLTSGGVRPTCELGGVSILIGNSSAQSSGRCFPQSLDAGVRPLFTSGPLHKQIFAARYACRAINNHPLGR